MTVAAVPANSGPAATSLPTAGLTALAGPGVLGATTLAVTVVAVLRLAGSALPAQLGPALLAVAVVVGLPHGALDTALVTAGRRDARSAAVGAGYLAAAVAAWLAWSRWPGAGLAALLVASAAHFAVADLVIQRWRHPQSSCSWWAVLSAAASGTVAVAGPFAWWPGSTGPVLDRLGVGASTAVVTTTCRVLLSIAVALALAAVCAACLRRVSFATPIGSAVVEPFVLVALTAVCPPLTAFAVYFAGWHALRQSARLLVLHPGAARALRSGGWRPATVVLIRQAAVPTVVALTVLAALAVRAQGLTASLLAGLLAVSVPHAAVTAAREWRTGHHGFGDRHEQSGRCPPRARSQGQWPARQRP